MVETTPRGLLNARYSRSGLVTTRSPSTWITAVAGSTLSPRVATTPSTLTRRTAIISSQARRDPTPAAAKAFCNRTSRPVGSPGRTVGLRDWLGLRSGLNLPARLNPRIAPNPRARLGLRPRLGPRARLGPGVRLGLRSRLGSRGRRLAGLRRTRGGQVVGVGVV